MPGQTQIPAFRQISDRYAVVSLLQNERFLPENFGAFIVFRSSQPRENTPEKL